MGKCETADLDLAAQAFLQAASAMVDLAFWGLVWMAFQVCTFASLCYGVPSISVFQITT